MVIFLAKLSVSQGLHICIGLNCMYLLYISGLEDTENREIYEKYMHFGRISYIGKKSTVGTRLN
jgi:hypothetical protein